MSCWPRDREEEIELRAHEKDHEGYPDPEHCRFCFAEEQELEEQRREAERELYWEQQKND